MNKKSKEPRTSVTLTLPKSSKLKAQQLATSMGITLSHLIEGLIEGIQISSGLTKEYEN